MYFAFYLKSYFFLLPKSSLSLVARACVFPQACHNPQFLTVLHFSPLRPFFCQLRKTFHFMFFFFFLASFSSQALSLLYSYLLHVTMFYISSLLLSQGFFNPVHHILQEIRPCCLLLSLRHPSSPFVSLTSHCFSFFQAIFSSVLHHLPLLLSLSNQLIVSVGSGAALKLAYIQTVAALPQRGLTNIKAQELLSQLMLSQLMFETEKNISVDATCSWSSKKLGTETFHQY